MGRPIQVRPEPFYTNKGCMALIFFLLAVAVAIVLGFTML
jgi:hypothetical protein